MDEGDDGRPVAFRGADPEALFHQAGPERLSQGDGMGFDPLHPHLGQVVQGCPQLIHGAERHGRVAVLPAVVVDAEVPGGPAAVDVEGPVAIRRDQVQ